LLQDKVLCILRPHARKLEIVLFGAGVVGESGKNRKSIGVILKERSYHFQTVMTIERNVYLVQSEQDIFGFDTDDFGLGNGFNLNPGVDHIKRSEAVHRIFVKIIERDDPRAFIQRCDIRQQFFAFGCCRRTDQIEIDIVFIGKVSGHVQRTQLLSAKLIGPIAEYKYGGFT